MNFEYFKCFRKEVNVRFVVEFFRDKFSCIFNKCFFIKVIFLLRNVVRDY